MKKSTINLLIGRPLPTLLGHMTLHFVIRQSVQSDHNSSSVVLYPAFDFADKTPKSSDKISFHPPTQQCSLNTKTPNFPRVLMSGFEVVGVVLGAIPILLSAVEELKKVTVIFRKRQHVKHLATALLADKELLTQILISLLSNSGCKDTFLLKDDPVRYLKDNAIRDQVRDYLGKEAFAACNGLILQCHETVKKMATKIAGLVPTIQVQLSIPTFLRSSISVANVCARALVMI